jgi:hypothetical protein
VNGCQAKHKEELCRQNREAAILEVLWAYQFVKKDMLSEDRLTDGVTDS